MAKKTSELTRHRLIDDAVTEDIFVDMLAPDTSAGLCLGEDVVIEWQTAEAINLVSVRLIGPNGTWDIGSFPASYNETGADDHSGQLAWTVGEVGQGGSVGEAEGYQLAVVGHLPPRIRELTDDIVEDTSGRPFAIQDCRG